MMRLDNSVLANKIFDALSEEYDDNEECREEVVQSLIDELDELDSRCLRIVIERLCERVDDLLEYTYTEYEED